MGIRILSEKYSIRRPRSRFPLTEALHDFFESLDNFVDVRSLSWVILDHVMNEWLHEFEIIMSAYVPKVLLPLEAD